MFGPVLPEVAALTKGREVAGPAVGGIMVEMSRSEINARRPEPRIRWGPRTKRLSRVATPSVSFVVPPASVGRLENGTRVRSRAPFATPLGTFESDQGRKLRPIYRIEPAVQQADRHLFAISLQTGAACEANA